MQVPPDTITLEHYNGTISLFSPFFSTILNPHPSHRLHVTLVTPAEYKSIGLPHPLHVAQELSIQYVYVVGEASKRGSAWKVVVWNHANVWRSNHGLAAKDFHLTLSEEPGWDLDKSIDFLIHSRGVPAFLEDIRSLDLEGYDHLSFSCKSAPPELRYALAEHMIVTQPKSYKGYVRLADAVAAYKPKLALLAYGQAVSLWPSLLAELVQFMRRLRDRASYGPVVTPSELEDLPANIRDYLLLDWPEALDEGLNAVFWSHPTEPRDRAIYKGQSLPRYFSFIYPNIAGMSTPRSEADINLLILMGFTHVLTLTKEEPLPKAWFDLKPIQHLYIPIENYGAPTLEEMDFIYNQVTESGKWLIHCGGGVGRAGTVLACLIAMYGNGVEPNSDVNPRVEAHTAVTLLRQSRPKSVESRAQLFFVGGWVKRRWRMHHKPDPILPEPNRPMRTELKTQPDPTRPRALMMIGIPGSGKSWLTEAIMKRRGKGKTIVISQDESGSRDACVREFSKNYPNDVLVILDRCNPLWTERKEWVKMTNRPCIAIHFDYPKALCEQRISSRVNHPTLRAGGGRARAALKQMAEDMSAPTLAEGFENVFTIPSFHASWFAVQYFAAPLGPCKFPRTPHLLDLGATTKDDVVKADFEVLEGNLTVEEKIDGANMGISLDNQAMVRVQNRSHWVNSQDQEQFRPLDNWIANHADVLRRLLYRDPTFPERYILYGEWMVAQHSIHYTHLPDRFIAFDLYDRYEETFLSRSALTTALTGSGIYQVPLITKSTRLTRQEVLGFIQEQAVFSQVSRREGVYVRFEDDAGRLTIDRGKVVRGDFIAGNEHWSKAKIVLNGILQPNHFV